MHGRAHSLKENDILCKNKAHVRPAVTQELIYSSKLSHHRHGKEQMSGPLKCKGPGLLHCQISSIKRAC